MRHDKLSAYRHHAVTTYPLPDEVRFAPHPTVKMPDTLAVRDTLHLDVPTWATGMLGLGADPATISSTLFEFQNADPYADPSVHIDGPTLRSDIVYSPHIAIRVPYRERLSHQDVTELNHYLRLGSIMSLREYGATPAARALRRTPGIRQLIGRYATGAVRATARRLTDWQPISVTQD